MNDSRKWALLKLQSGDLPEQTPFCPEDHVIAEFYDGMLSPRERPLLKKHLSACRFCQARIGILHRAETGTTSRRVYETELAAAKRLVTAAPRRFSTAWRYIATAAVLVLALYVVIEGGRAPVDHAIRIPEPGAATGAAQRSVRSAGTFKSSIRILQPAEGSTIGPGTTVRWEPIAGCLHYDLFLLNAAGDVLWTKRLQENEWAVANEISLKGSGPVYLRIDASLEDGRTVTSGHLALRAAGGG